MAGRKSELEFYMLVLLEQFEQLVCYAAAIFGKHTSMCNCTILITSSTLITSSIHKKTNYGTYSMALMVNSGHFEKWPPNLLRGES